MLGICGPTPGWAGCLLGLMSKLGLPAINGLKVGLYPVEGKKPGFPGAPGTFAEPP